MFHHVSFCFIRVESDAPRTRPMYALMPTVASKYRQRALVLPFTLVRAPRSIAAMLPGNYGRLGSTKLVRP